MDERLVYTIDFVSYSKFAAEERIFKFLEGLNLDDPVCSRVLEMDPLPFLQKAFAFAKDIILPCFHQLLVKGRL